VKFDVYSILVASSPAERLTGPSLPLTDSLASYSQCESWVSLIPGFVVLWDCFEL
jgi:hypothetical protein